jgi:hypothetical protein
VIEEAVTAGLPGLIATCIFEPSVSVARFERYARLAEESGGGMVFAGLTCAPEELRARMTSPDRGPLGTWTDFEGLHRTMASGYFDFPENLPGTAFALDTSGVSAAETARVIVERLPHPPAPSPRASGEGE